VQRPPEASNFFFGYSVAISFPNRIDVWGTHFEAAKVMTFASVT